MLVHLIETAPGPVPQLEDLGPGAGDWPKFCGRDGAANPSRLDGSGGVDGAGLARAELDMAGGDQSDPARAARRLGSGLVYAEPGRGGRYGQVCRTRSSSVRSVGVPSTGVGFSVVGWIPPAAVLSSVARPSGPTVPNTV